MTCSLTKHIYLSGAKPQFIEIFKKFVGVPPDEARHFLAGVEVARSKVDQRLEHFYIRGAPNFIHTNLEWIKPRIKLHS